MELFELEADLPALGQPVLVQALSGFIDAGAGVRLARQQILDSTEHRVVATFDVDALIDYRSRRPGMIFQQDHWEAYDDPVLAVRVVHDAAGTPFLLLAGPEPDLQWERFTAAVATLVQQLGVRLTVGLNAIPMAVPHSRPIGVTAHGTRRELVADHEPWLQTVQVPASAGHLLEYRLGKSGRDAMGFAVHVPHYLAQAEFPGAAVVLLDSVSRASGLALPTDALREADTRVRAEIDEQVAQSEEVTSVVRALEQQYDAFVAERGRGTLLAEDSRPLPTADELGAELERFLAEQGGPGDARDT